MYVDAHAHLDKYGDDKLDRIRREIERNHILTLSVSVDVSSFTRNEAIANDCGLVVPCFGIHPAEASRYVDSLTGLLELAERSPMFGEIGLDYRFVTDESLHAAQRQVFEWFLTLAQDQNKIISVHSAGAEQDVAHLLRRYDSVRAIIHWYSGSFDVLSQMIDAGLTFSVGVEVLHSDHIKRLAAAIPADQLLTETDNPGGLLWLAETEGYPHLIADVVDVLSNIRGVSRNDLMTTVRANAMKLLEGDDHMTSWRSQLSV